MNPPRKPTSAQKQHINRQRWEILHQLEDWLEAPMIVLGLAWLVLFVIELVSGLTPLLEAVGTCIWVVFILDFLLKFTLAPEKLTYLRQNWLTAIALLVPALRVFRIARLARVLQLTRATRGLRLFRIVTSLNRGMKALGRTMRRRGAGYVVALSLLVLLVGSAGMLAFESGTNGDINDYGTALWWTGMALTTMGTDYAPRSPEGRVLAFIIALYAFAVFGYLTATLATFFIGRDAASKEGEVAGEASVNALRMEIAGLRKEIQLLAQSQLEPLERTSTQSQDGAMRN
jgi:voltage-gated potassium channel